MRPKIVLDDEPTVSLGAENSRNILETIASLSRQRVLVSSTRT